MKAMKAHLSRTEPRDEPVAYLMTDVRNGRKRLTFDYGDHGMHDAITKLYTRPFDPQEAMRLADEYAVTTRFAHVPSMVHEARAALARYLGAA